MICFRRLDRQLFTQLRSKLGDTMKVGSTIKYSLTYFFYVLGLGEVCVLGVVEKGIRRFRLAISFENR